MPSTGKRIADEAEAVLDSVKGELGDACTEVEEYIADRPLQAVLAAFVAGLLIGRLL